MEEFGDKDKQKRGDSKRARAVEAKKIEKQMQVNDKGTSLLTVKYNNHSI